MLIPIKKCWLSTSTNTRCFKCMFNSAGQAGHDEPPETSLAKIPLLMGNEYKYDLDAQVKHKVINIHHE